MTRPALPCCVPFVNRYFPSGSAWVHSQSCKAVDRVSGTRLAMQKVRPGDGVPSLAPSPGTRPSDRGAPLGTRGEGDGPSAKAATAPSRSSVSATDATRAGVAGEGAGSSKPETPPAPHHRYYPDPDQDRRLKDAGGKQLWPQDWGCGCNEIPTGLCERCEHDARRLYDESLDVGERLL